MRPIYSPIKPSTSINMPPIKRSADIKEVYPKRMSGKSTFCTIIYMPAIRPIMAQKKPIKVAIRRGFTENAVKPLIHKEIKPAMV